MTRPTSRELTPGEARLMHVLWKVGEVDVSTLGRELGDELAPSTIRTMLSILVRKRLVKRRSDAGRAHIYSATTDRGTAERKGWKELSRKFLRSPSELALHVLEDTQLTPSDRQRLMKLLKDAEEDAS